MLIARFKALRDVNPLRNLRCSFCRRSEREVERLVAGQAGYICDSCVVTCVRVLQENGGYPKSDRPH